MMRKSAFNQEAKSLRVLLVSLRTFSSTGGVEKVCRNIAWCLQKLDNEQKLEFSMLSLYDRDCDERYVVQAKFDGYGGWRAAGSLAAVEKGTAADIVILSHINLAPVGLAIKMLSPSTRLVLWAHGIEIWSRSSGLKAAFLQRVDMVVAVSNYTAGRILHCQSVEPKKVKIIPNSLDPCFKVPNLNQISFRPGLHNKLNLPAGVPVFFALTRLSITEKNKHYDQVIRQLGELKKEGFLSKYILGGKYDKMEYDRLVGVARDAGFYEDLYMPGFIEEDQLMNYLRLADAFVLPSEKEGFGIAFIEAQACGSRVLAGNRDGSVEAVGNSCGGRLIDPYDQNDLKLALKELIISPGSYQLKVRTQQQSLQRFSQALFFQRIKDLIHSLALSDNKREARIGSLGVSRFGMES